MKKEYIKPEIKIVDMKFNTNLLSSSSAEPDDECGDNPWWCDRQPSPDDWWGKN